jgi:nucleotide-binding universal stress UspA family protein
MKGGRMFHKILAPLDGSKLAEQALPYAAALAQKFNGELILLWVIQPLPVAVESGVADDDAYLTAEREEAQAYLNKLQAIYQRRHIATRVIVLTSPAVAEAIIDAAVEFKADVIVKTTHGRSGLSRFLYGSVAARVLQQAPCPVLLIRISK